MTATQRPPGRRSQAERRAQSRGALLESAARGLSRHGYGNLVLEQVASDAGYTRGAIYHLFSSKEELALAVVAWVEETWYAELAPAFGEGLSPVDALVGVARGHAIYCRRDVAGVMMTLRVEFSDQDHRVGRAVNDVVGRVAKDLARLIAAGRKDGSIPPGPPPRLLAAAALGAVEGVVIQMAGRAPHDVLLAERTMLGVLGVPATAASRGQLA